MTALALSTPTPSACSAPGPSASPQQERGFTTREEFARLVTPHLARMVRTARAFVDSDDLAWDAVQETLVRIWLQGWLPPQTEAALGHLVQRSARHLSRCLWRRRVHEEQALERRAPCCAADPLSSIEGEEMREQLGRALGKLTREYRVVFELHELQGCSYEEIALGLAIPVGTVRSRLSRARGQLREHLTRNLFAGTGAVRPAFQA